MSRHSLAALQRIKDVRRQMLVFSLMGILLVVVVLGLVKGGGTDMASSALVQLPPSNEIGWNKVPALFVTGLAAGFLAGMIGMGGGVLKMCGMLLFFGMTIHFARAVSLVTMFFSSGAALWRYLRNGQVLWGFAIPMVMLGVLGALLGATIGNGLVSTTLSKVFGFFVLFLSFNTLALLFADPGESMMRHNFQGAPVGQQGYYAALIGGLHGSVCGLMGISGGVVATPLQQVVLNVPLRHAIGNTLFASTAVTAVASSVVMWTGISSGEFSVNDLVFVDFFMGTGATIAAPIGAKLSEGCNVSWLRLLFVGLTLTAGLSITMG